MRCLMVALGVALLTGCREGEALDPVRPCAPVPPSSHWPSDPGILELPATPAPVSFTSWPHRAPPPIVKPGAIVMSRPRIVAVVAEGDPLAETAFAFADAVPGSSFWPTTTAAWGVSGISAGPHITSVPMAAQQSASDSVAYVQAAVAGTDAQPDGSTIYLLFLAPGTDAVDPRGIANCGCAALSGYHVPFDDSGDALAIVQRCSSTNIDQLTVVASHELVESATNPSDDFGFYEPGTSLAWQASPWAGEEIADICEGTRVHEGAFSYQRIFSNAAAKAGNDPCVPALPDPYFNVVSPKTWYPLPLGQTIEVPITGWSTAPMQDWFVYPAPSLDMTFDVTFESDEGEADGIVTFYGLNNDKTGTLTVTNVAALGGDSIIVNMISRLGSPGSDPVHLWPVGFYVPTPAGAL